MDLHGTPLRVRLDGLTRRDFVRVCTIAAAAVGLPSSAAAKFIETIEQGKKPSVIWLSLQECTGCTESLLRTSHPCLADLILDVISLDYHETLFAAAGLRAEEARRSAIEEHGGQYVLVVEGAVPMRDGGIYCRIGGRPAVEVLRESAEKAALIVAIGSCASWGGISSADPNPTEAKGVSAVLPDKTVVSVPGCPPNPYNFLGIVLQYATWGTLPALDEEGRPVAGYGRTIHEHCPRRPHFDAGRFAKGYGDAGHRQGYCLYELGCKGPQTHANCSTLQFSELPGVWPIGIGHPCVGCTEQSLGFRVPLHETIAVPNPTPGVIAPDTEARGNKVSAVATGLAGLIGGALLGAGIVGSRKLDEAEARAAAKETEP